MQLEKVSSQSGEAGLAGWISSNDVTLFTVVMVVVVAVFLQTNLVKGSKKNVELTAKNLSLAGRNDAARQEIERILAELKTTGGELTAARRELSTASASLAATQAELAETVQRLATTRTALDDTTRQRDELERLRRDVDEKLAQRQADVERLRQALASLEIEKGELLTSRDQLDQRTQQLAQQRDQLDVSLAELTAELEEKLGQLGDLQRERDLLNERSLALAERVQRLEQQLGAKEKGLAELQQSSQNELESLKQLLARALERNTQTETASQERLQTVLTRAEQADAKASEAVAQADDYLQRLQRAAALFKDLDENKRLLQLEVEALKTQLANALDDLQAAQQQVAAQQRRDKSLSRELIGLRGELGRVAILFDSSGSMVQRGRWEEVQRIAASWLDHLEVEECVLIVFASDTLAFPADGSLLPVAGSQGAANRQKLMIDLNAVEPKGWTNTLAAMEKAYSYPDIDTIILFSDGAPTYENSNQFNAEAAEKIYALCRQHPEIPINAIGLGDYFEPTFGAFLQNIALLSGGTFVGR